MEHRMLDDADKHDRDFAEMEQHKWDVLVAQRNEAVRHLRALLAALGRAENVEKFCYGCQNYIDDPRYHSHDCSKEAAEVFAKGLE